MLDASTFSKSVWAVAMAAHIVAPALGSAQDRIEPAGEIRVVEIAERTGRVSRVIVEDLTPAEILRVQVALSRAGYDPRSRSGVLDESTRRTLTSFQAARGLQICGCVTYETVVALQIAPKVVARVDGGSAGYGSTVIVDRRAPVYVVVPGYGFYHRRLVLGPGVVVGHSPSVIVGHEPAVGAGQLQRRRLPSDGARFPSGDRRVPMRPERRNEVGSRPTSTPPGAALRPGPREQATTGGGLRGSRP